jgi:hypothetical protein
VRQGLKWIPEEDQKVDLTIDYFGADLLVTPERASLKLVNVEAKFSL